MTTSDPSLAVAFTQLIAGLLSYLVAFALLSATRRRSRLHFENKPLTPKPPRAAHQHQKRAHRLLKFTPL
jgi:hypothetical protein